MNNPSDKAHEILSIYRFYRLDGELYNDVDEERLDELFEAVVMAISDAGILKPFLPQAEFVAPCRGILERNPAWLQRFEHKDTRAFFLSDIYDFLRLFVGRTRLRVN
jgi:hypothetical protein